MTKTIENKLIEFIIKYNEGGYVNDIRDTGGETKFGISKKSYPNEDIKNLTIDRAVEIYKRDYLSKIPVIADIQLYYQVLDMAINAGVKTAVILYEKNKTLDSYKTARIDYYKKLKGWQYYSKSWVNRVNRTIA